MKTVLNLVLIVMALLVVGCQKKTDGPNNDVSAKELFEKNKVKGEVDTMKERFQDFKYKKGFGTINPARAQRSRTQVAIVYIPRILNKIDDAVIPKHVINLKVKDDEWLLDDDVESYPYSFNDLRKIPLPHDEVPLSTRSDMIKESNSEDKYDVPVTIK